MESPCEYDTGLSHLAGLCIVPSVGLSIIFGLTIVCILDKFAGELKPLVIIYIGLLSTDWFNS